MPNDIDHGLYLVTANLNKVASFKAILRKHALDLKITFLNEEYPENKEEGTTERVVLDGAKYCAEKFGKKVIVQDTGLFISALKGFPGVNIKYAIKTIGYTGILDLLAASYLRENSLSRNAIREFSLGYCEPGLEPVSFTAQLVGKIADQPIGTQGFGFDPIFIPEGYDITFGQDSLLRDRLSPFGQTIDQLAQYLQTSFRK